MSNQRGVESQTFKKKAFVKISAINYFIHSVSKTAIVANKLGNNLAKNLIGPI
jgi:hypothetical protein